MSHNSFGKLFKVTPWGESHGKAIGCIIDACPPLISLNEKDFHTYLDLRKPGTSKFVTQRKEDDKVEILSGVFKGKTTGTPISLIIYNKDQKSKDYGDIKNKFRPGHADLSIFLSMESAIIEVVVDRLLERQQLELRLEQLHEK